MQIFIEKILPKKTNLEQFHDNKEYIFNENIKFKGAELKEILKQVQDSIIDKKELDWNEIVGYVPKINAVVAKAQNLREVPKSALNFAKENDLAILLL